MRVLPGVAAIQNKIGLAKDVPKLREPHEGGVEIGGEDHGELPPPPAPREKER